ncbi:peptidoglycan-binding protein [Pokkaliibacter plantistimulans]|nr:peptidoglycan-binding protein [Pokkaliibacter plantistimulans]
MINRMTLRPGMKGAQVKELQQLLNALLTPSPALSADGDFGQKTKEAVLEFQQQAELKADGVVGPATWKALTQSTVSQSTVPLPQYRLADIAKDYLGVKETGNNRAGNSARLQEIFEADDLVVGGKTDGYPWCAAFVSLCVQKLCQQSGYFGTLNPPREASVSNFLNVWAKNQGCLIFSPSSTVDQPVKGDIVVFTFSHIGIVESNDGTSLTTIEGNTNAAGSREGQYVARKHRSFGAVRKFIRLPMTTSALGQQLGEFLRYC